MTLIDRYPVQGFATEVEQETNTVNRGVVGIHPIGPAFHFCTYA